MSVPRAIQPMERSRDRQDVIITGASQGIGAGLANSFLEKGYKVVATSRRVSQ